MLLFTFLGFVVGVLVGLTGVGGGALMTPSLIFLGVEPLTAVGTDLVYASVTKIFGTIFHRKKGNIELDTSLKLFAGSFPAIIIGSQILRYVNRDLINHHLTVFLGIILIITSILSLRKGRFEGRKSLKSLTLILLGFFVGLVVQFTSVGAGVLVGFILANFTTLNPRYVVGTTVFYGLMLSLVSAASHISLGNVNYYLSLWLVLGTIPGVYFGTHLNSIIKKDKLRRVINMLILFTGMVTIASVFNGFKP
ncbi:MAG: uncharacterized protein PWQ47_1340 [Methanothermococcus sp.]|nr:uncharacterized protein [Methanothermococcus sp.]